jgi:hypothetical protein
MADSDADVILRSLLAERGGEQTFDVASLAIARHLSRMLADEKASPSAIEGLMALLPSARKPDDAYDLGRLNKTEFAELDRLCGIARGELPETPAPKTHAELYAPDLIDALVALERSGCVPRWKHRGEGERLPTESEMVEVRSAINNLIEHVGLDAETMWTVEGRSDYGTRYIKKPAAGAGEASAGLSGEERITDDPKPVATPSTDGTVVPLRPRSIHDGAPLQTYSEPWRGHTSGGAGAGRFDHPRT